jgi:hypothetical protein
MEASEPWSDKMICVCGKAAMDGIRCRFGATHKPLNSRLPSTLPWEAKPEKLPWER